MGWQDLADKFKGAAPVATNASEPEANNDARDVNVTISTPIRGFTVLHLAYPNHQHPEFAPMTAYDIALRLSHDMDVDWFGNTPDLKQYACTGPVRGNDENDDAFGFDFGVYDSKAEDFVERYTVIVRETAGGGFMLLIQDSAMAFANKTRELFKAIVDDPERDNSELLDDGEETAIQ